MRALRSSAAAAAAFRAERRCAEIARTRHREWPELRNKALSALLPCPLGRSRNQDTVFTYPRESNPPHLAFKASALPLSYSRSSSFAVCVLRCKTRFYRSQSSTKRGCCTRLQSTFFALLFTRQLHLVAVRAFREHAIRRGRGYSPHHPRCGS